MNDSISPGLPPTPSAAGAASASASATIARRIDAIIDRVARHWLAILLIGMGIFVTLPFLAPVAMAAGWTWLGKLIYTMYIPFCHQLPQRSWFLFGEKLTYTLDEINRVYPSTNPWHLRFFYGSPEMGWKVAWSDRMISFYGMIPVYGALYAWLRRRRGRPLPPIPLWAFIALLAPMALDGGTHWLNDLLYGVSGGGFRDTNAWLATLTGHAWPGFYAGDHFGTFNWWMRLITGVLGAWGIAFFGLPWADRLMTAEEDIPDMQAARGPQTAA